MEVVYEDNSVYKGEVMQSTKIRHGHGTYTATSKSGESYEGQSYLRSEIIFIFFCWPGLPVRWCLNPR